MRFCAKRTPHSTQLRTPAAIESKRALCGGNPSSRTESRIHLPHLCPSFHMPHVFGVLQADIAIRHVVAGFSPRSFSLTERSFVGNRARAEAHDYVPDAKLWLGYIVEH